MIQLIYQELHHIIRQTSTCDEPVLVDLGLETFKRRKDFCELKWYCKINHMNDDRLPFTSNERNKVRSFGGPRIHWLAHVNFLKQQLKL